MASLAHFPKFLSPLMKDLRRIFLHFSNIGFFSLTLKFIFLFLSYVEISWLLF